ncbi:MAG: DUF6056 family protein [Anaerolineae bacterium]|jgi:hypothetical protein|nr:DUF6056 family protein [Anaerolineae bacterium]
MAQSAMIRQRIGLILTAVVILLPSLMLIYLGQFNRAMADDYCFTFDARRLGLFGAVDNFYRVWSGTYSSTFFQSLVGLNEAWSLVPIILSVLWLIAAMTLAYQVAKILNTRETPWVTLIIGGLIVYAANDGTANVFQSLFWTSGAITYTAPLIVLTFNIALCLYALRTFGNRPLSPAYFALVAGGCMWAGGYSPLFAVFQVTLFTLLTLGSVIGLRGQIRRNALALFATGFIFALTALIILLIAPGNSVRRSYFEDPLPFGQVISNTILSTIGFVPTMILLFSAIAVITPLIIGVFLGLTTQPLDLNQRIFLRQHGTKLLPLTLLLLLILVAACFFTALYSIWTLPPARAYIIPQTMLVITSFTWGYIMGASLQRPRWSPIFRGIGVMLLIGGLVFGPIATTLEYARLIPLFSTFAREWDQRDQQLTHSDDPAVSVSAFTVDLADYAGLEAVDDDSTIYCYPRFYDKDTITILQR